VDHFEDVRLTQPGPEPGCIPPPSEELAACPRTARHWIVTARTAKYHLGHPFQDNYVNAYGHELNRLKPIFEIAAQSFLKTILPNSQNLALIQSARDEFVNLVGKGSFEYLAVHLRRGDKHAISWRYKGGYVPISEYADAVSATALRLFADAQTPIPLYIASDSPTAQSELVGALSTSTKAYTLASSTLPNLNAIASPTEYVQTEFDQLPEEERVSLTRGALLDFAMLSGMWTPLGQPLPRAMICTLSSSICRLSAIGLGWDRAFGEVDKMGNADGKVKGWVEIDNANIIDPSWEAFELFA